jgi:hypothetical protein
VTQTLFCFDCHAQISPKPECFMKWSWYLWKALDKPEVHRPGFRLFGATLWKLLIDYWTHFLNENKPLNRWFSHYNLGPKP